VYGVGAMSLVLGLLISAAPALLGGQDDIQAQEAAAKAIPIPELRAADLPVWRKHLRPTADELAWREIPWLSTFTEGVLAAAEQEKPLLFWTMNGHPLGCT